MHAFTLKLNAKDVMSDKNITGRDKRERSNSLLLLFL